MGVPPVRGRLLEGLETRSLPTLGRHPGLGDEPGVPLPAAVGSFCESVGHMRGRAGGEGEVGVVGIGLWRGSRRGEVKMVL